MLKHTVYASPTEQNRIINVDGSLGVALSGFCQADAYSSIRVKFIRGSDRLCEGGVNSNAEDIAIIGDNTSSIRWIAP